MRSWHTLRTLWVMALLGGWLLPPGGAAASPPMQLAKGLTQENARGMAIAEAFVRESTTFRFDGLDDSVRLEAARPLTACPGCYEYTWYFESQFPGYGDRTGVAIAPARTPHRAKIVVAGEAVVSGVLDNAWDMARQMILDLE
jgi:hypothetical protein